MFIQLPELKLPMIMISTRSLLVFLLIASNTCLAQERFVGFGKFEEWCIEIDELNGGPTSGFRKCFQPDFFVELSIDDSQSVTFHELTVSHEQPIIFREDLGFRDVEVKRELLMVTTDLNPYGPDAGVFSMRFNPPEISFRGTYFNRSFENTVSTPFAVDRFNLTALLLDFTEFPNALNLRSEFSNNGNYTSANIVQIEPFLTLESIALSTPFGASLTLFAAPENVAAAVRLIPGDSNMDDRFNSSDLVEVFTTGEFEDGIPLNSTWREGDWNGDKEFDSGDFVYAFTAGSYSSEAIPVPEPRQSLGTILIMAIVGLRWLWTRSHD
ncbi:MAG: hypothetical protein KDA87_24175 [Planctomycetales bacterium]|nr:hypothetical protein [Planctomycetales bacterium]